MEEEMDLPSRDVPVASPSHSSGRESDSIQNNQPRYDTKALAVAVGIVRILEVILTCISFSLVASVGHSTNYLWTFCMFTWCFCFCITLLILLLEFTRLNTKLSISWDDFSFAFAIVAALAVLAASFFYPIFFVYSENIKGIGATVTSCLACILYAIEVFLKLWTCVKSGQKRRFLSIFLYFLKLIEVFYVCIIFIWLHINHSKFPGLQWCVAVYSICLIFTVVVIVSTICSIQSLFSAPFDKVHTVCNVLAVLMYITAVVIWSMYSFQNNLSYCISESYFEGDCVYLGIFFMTCVNLLVYIVDTVYPFILVFFGCVSTENSRNL